MIADDGETVKMARLWVTNEMNLESWGRVVLTVVSYISHTSYCVLNGSTRKQVTGKSHRLRDFRWINAKWQQVCWHFALIHLKSRSLWVFRPWNERAINNVSENCVVLRHFGSRVILCWQTQGRTDINGPSLPGCAYIEWEIMHCG